MTRRPPASRLDLCKPPPSSTMAAPAVLTAAAELETVQKLLLARYKLSYRVAMLFYRLGRRLRGKQSVADGAALAITLE